MLIYVSYLAAADDDDDIVVPAPTGRHFQRQHLSGVLISYHQQLVAEFALRNCAYMGVNGASEHFVCAWGVFCCAAA